MEDFRKVLFECRDLGVKFERIHMANSAGTMAFPESRGNLVRIGILAYGIDPLNLLEGTARPAMHWFSRITSLRKLPAGAPIGYCGTFVTQRPSVIATVGAGYGDGYPRNLSNKGHVWVNDALAPIVGLVCMDQMMLDVTDAATVEIGQTVELLGDHVRPPELAKVSGTNSHEIVTRIMSRVPRKYLYPT
ncbi:MAG: alanine racemase [Fimbriimonadaceae bacterium]|jgi:alanine racemase|nr:alanine racemase [Fimbriimonadaceae bacterium]